MVEAIQHAVEASWEAARSVIPNFRRIIRDLMEDHDSLKEALHPGQACLACVDEGETHGFRFVAAGLTRPAEKLDRLIERTGATIIRTHDNCGGMKAKFPHVAKINDYAKQLGAEEAAKRGLVHVHVTAQEMKRPADLHDAIGACYDVTGKFKPIPGFPKSFVVSRRYDEEATQDLAMCLKIAFSESGFGHRFTPDHPFHILTLLDPHDRLLSGQAKREAQEVAEPYGSRVRVVQFRTPTV